MVKKADLKNLVGEFIETPPGGDLSSEKHPTIAQRSDLSQEDAERYEVTPEMQERLNAVRRLKVGRPRGRKNGDPKEREARATFIVKPEVIRRVKYIALADTKLFKNVIDEALCSYVEQWEKENGKINFRNRKK